jgi:hypothetical protein
MKGISILSFIYCEKSEPLTGSGQKENSSGRAPLPRDHLSGCLAAQDLRELLLLCVDEGARGAGAHASRDLQVGAAVAFDSFPGTVLAAYNAIGADYGTHPASHTFLWVSVHYTAFGILAHSSSAADRNTGRILAVTADQGKLEALYLLYVEPLYRAGRLGL